MEMKYGWPVVEVKINEEGPFSLILDTGCSSLTLSPEVIDRLQLPEIGSSTSSNAAGQSHVSKTYGVETVQLGPASLQRIGAHRSDYIKQSFPEIDGLFGQRNFGNLMMTMDFQGETLTLRKPLLAKHQDPEWVPITIKQGNPELSLKIGSNEIPFLIDTGSLGSLNVGESQVVNLPLHENRYQELDAASGGLPLRTQTTRMTSELLLGKQKLVQPYVSWYEGTEGRNLIGMKILRYFTLELDLKNKQARFIRSATTPVSFANRKRLGFNLAYYKGDGVFKVANVRPYQSEGETLRVGDRVISIDGVEMHQVDEQTLRKFRETQDQLNLGRRASGSYDCRSNIPCRKTLFLLTLRFEKASEMTIASSRLIWLNASFNDQTEGKIDGNCLIKTSS